MDGLDCAMNAAGVRCVGAERCAFHSWRRTATCHELGSLPLPEARRLTQVFPPAMRRTTVGEGFRASGQLILAPRAAPSAAGPDLGRGGGMTPHRRLARFMRLLAHLQTAPWAAMEFSVNTTILRRLTAAHVHLIAPGGDLSTMMHLVDPHNSLVGAKNLVWITNRQQGKTTTLGKFIAAMAIASPMGGFLAAVYGTSLDRAQELTKAAKQYVTWMQTPEGRMDDFPTLTLGKNNERVFTVHNGEAANTVAARPKNTDSCRGDNPWFGIVDEVAFIAPDFWYKFIYPLLQVESRAFTCATTPPPADGFFQAFVDQVIERNRAGDYFFRLVNHSLACATCLENEDADRCCHQLHLIPPWKSLVRFNRMKALIPASKLNDFQTEVYGVLAAATLTYLPGPLVDAAAARERVRGTGRPFDVVWVSVDPASHGVSDMAMVAFGVNGSGMHVVLGLSAVNMKRCQTTEVQEVVNTFLAALRALPLLDGHTMLVPIVECNNNEILAMSIVQVFKRHGPIWMPFTSDKFDAYITCGVGVWTKAENKMAGIQATYQAFMDGRVTYAEQLATADATVFRPRARRVPVDDLVTKLGDQLKALRDQPDGSVSGKSPMGDNDDLAMAFVMGVFWALSVRAHEVQSSR